MNDTVVAENVLIDEKQQRMTILVVEDDRNMRELVANVLAGSEHEFETVSVENVHLAIDYLENHQVAVVVTDLRMPGGDGMDVLHFAKAQSPYTQVVLLTGYATVESAVEALKSGAFDYIRKPFDNVDLLCTVERALQHHLLSTENQRLREQQRVLTNGDGLIGQSQAMAKLRRLIDSAASYDCSVLIYGESGCGKELVARQIHMQSKRNRKAFIAVNCAAIPENLIESELFGYRKGAFTGADRNKPGLFETADGGTLFLDEINNASPSLQAKLLRVLQDGSFYPTGDITPRAVDVRIIAATNRMLTDLIVASDFREDLFYRLTVMELSVAPLRERRDDIPLLTHFFLNKFSSLMGKPVSGVTTDVLGALMRYDWPGNVRELENTVQRMLILTEDKKVGIDVLPQRIVDNKSVHGRALDYLSPQSLNDIEAYFIHKTLRDTNGDRALAAEILGIDKSTLWRKIKRYESEC